MSYRYDWYYDRDSACDYGVEPREDYYNDGIDEMFYAEGEFIEAFPTMSHSERLKEFERWPERASLVQEDLTGDEGFELLSTAIKHGASLCDFSQQVHTRFTPEQYYELWEIAVGRAPYELTSSVSRFIPADKYRELYRFGMTKVEKAYPHMCAWKVLYEHQSTITSVISDEEHCQIMTEFFLSYPEELNSFTREMPRDDAGKRFCICKGVVSRMPSALELIYIYEGLRLYGETPRNDLPVLESFSDEQLDELEDCAEQGVAFTDLASQTADASAAAA